MTTRQPTEARRGRKAQGRGVAPAARGKADKGAGKRVEGQVVDAPNTLPGARLRAFATLARIQWYGPLRAGAQSTTRQAEILHTAAIAQPTDSEGVAIGRDVLSRTLVAHDPHTAYRRKTITSPATVVCGNVGTGKSSLIKTVYALRPLILKGRRVVVLDKKANGASREGEYAEVTRAFGAEPIRFSSRGAGAVLNPLDPRITGVGDSKADAAAGVQVLRALAEMSAGRDLDVWEDACLRSAFALTMAAVRDRDPVLADVLPFLHGAASRAPKELAAKSREKYEEAGVSAAFMLERFLADYPGVFDNVTSTDVKLSDRMTTFDMSDLPDDGPAVQAVAALANSWLLGTVRKDYGKATNLIAEEGWHLVGGPYARVFQSNTKLARDLGIAMIISIHQPADIPPDSPARAILRSADTVHIFRQARAEDVDAVVELFGLDAETRSTVATLPQGQHLLKIGSRPEIRVEHVRSAIEAHLTNTDVGMGA